MMRKTTIKQIKKGELFKLKDTESAPIWVRGDYDRSSKKYSIYRYDDVCHERFAKGDKEVFVEFYF